jgi:hypothetical protein
MSKKSSFSPSRAAKEALGNHGFIAHTRELLESEAWRSRSIYLVRLLNCLELEHLAHAGKENGFLCSTYARFAAHGVNLRFVKGAIDEGVARGLIKVTHQGGYRGAGRRDPSRYQLTYLSWKFIPAIGPPQYLEPTNEWKNFTPGKSARKPRPFNGTKAPSPNGHDPTFQHRKNPHMKATKRERERERYLKINSPTYGPKSAADRWDIYERIILEKYGDGNDDVDAAWRNRDRLH